MVGAPGEEYRTLSVFQRVLSLRAILDKNEEVKREVQKKCLEFKNKSGLMLGIRGKWTHCSVFQPVKPDKPPKTEWREESKSRTSQIQLG